MYVCFSLVACRLPTSILGTSDFPRTESTIFSMVEDVILHPVPINIVVILLECDCSSVIDTH